ncbi:MAG TPA: CPBP family glutamic-type intramembrane protease [Acidimicrobiia bacterium]|nr:CPBP family glutamic-type intramembrane protease [Acidimicrobiia bacterium]
MAMREPVGASRPETPEPAVAPLPPPGWYADPWGLHPWRWWDGTQWTGYAGATWVAPTTRRARSWFPPRTPRDTEGGVRGGGIAVLGVVAAIVLAQVFGLAAVGLGLGRHTTSFLLVSELGLWTGLLGACIAAVRRHGTGSLRDLGLARPRWSDLGIGTVAGLVGRVAAIIAVVPLVPLLRHAKPTRSPALDTTDLHSHTLAVIITVLIVVVGAPIVEELFFRGLVQGALTRRFGAFVAVWVQAAVFASAHYQFTMTAVQALVTVVSIFVVGLMLGVLRWRYQRLGPGMLAHATFNALAIVLILALA